MIYNYMEVSENGDIPQIIYRWIFGVSTIYGNPHRSTNLSGTAPPTLVAKNVLEHRQRTSQHRGRSASRPCAASFRFVFRCFFAQEKVRNGAEMEVSWLEHFWYQKTFFNHLTITCWHSLVDIKKIFFRGAWAESKCCGHGALWGESRMPAGLWTSQFFGYLAKFGEQFAIPFLSSGYEGAKELGISIFPMYFLLNVEPRSYLVTVSQP